MAHVAMGASWQGRKVRTCPVIWYALEGREEIPTRLRALEARLTEKDTARGNDGVPSTVLDRIPEGYREWRAEICRIAHRWENLYFARSTLGEVPTEVSGDEVGEQIESERYNMYALEAPPIVVIDTLSIALGGEDEKGPQAVGFVTDCLDLLKNRPDLGNPCDAATEDCKTND